MLGPLAVDPPSRRISIGARCEMLEPRVMRVLVALGEAEGKVLSRDDLIEQCWDGTIVGDNAINRVISRLRHALADLGGGAVRLETITKVGFRLVVDGQTEGFMLPGNSQTGEAMPVATATGGAGVAVWRRPWTRRAAALGLTGAGVALAWAGWSRSQRHVPDPRAVALYQRGQAILQTGEYETRGEAIKLYKQAVAIDPRYAEAWAGIAIGLRYPWGPLRPLGDPHEVRTAAGRALALDPDNADAQLAMITIYPLFRRWLEREPQLRVFLRDHPDSALGTYMQAEFLLHVGRLEEALAGARRVVEIDPMQHYGWMLRATAEFVSGRSNEASATFEEARARWPEEPGRYRAAFLYLLGSKRYSDAISYLSDTSRRPRTIPREVTESLLRLAKALATGRGIAEIKTGIRTAPASVHIESFVGSVQLMALLGMVVEMFALFEAYYFGGVVNGTRVAPPGPLDVRFTGLLFNPVVLALKDDPRHASLLERTGLEDYWRKSGTQPDFRRVLVKPTPQAGME